MLNRHNFFDLFGDGEKQNRLCFLWKRVSSATGLSGVQTMADYDRRVTVASADARGNIVEKALRLATIELYIFVRGDFAILRRCNVYQKFLHHLIHSFSFAVSFTSKGNS
jgi:hypothetical protein